MEQGEIRNQLMGLAIELSRAYLKADISGAKRLQVQMAPLYDMLSKDNQKSVDEEYWNICEGLPEDKQMGAIYVFFGTFTPDVSRGGLALKGGRRENPIPQDFRDPIDIIPRASQSKSWRDYIRALDGWGYTFKLNEMDAAIEVNGARMDDLLRAEIRTKMRESGYRSMSPIEDAYAYAAKLDGYHPIKDFFNGLEWDGLPNISTLASFFQPPDPFYIFLRRWLIGAIAKIMEGGQNAMLVLEGPQGIGKSHFARWLCPLDGYFTEGPLNPENKDDVIRLMQFLVWEVAELGSTTRKADREALKFFISQRDVTVRVPYAKYAITKAAACSLLGTFNDEAGLLSDPTGNRRFLIAPVESIDWGYIELDIHQIWAEAMSAYVGGEAWQLDSDELAHQERINENYEIDDPLIDLIMERFEVTLDENDWITTNELMEVLDLKPTRANAMFLGAACKKIGLEKAVRGDPQRKARLGIRQRRLLP